THGERLSNCQALSEVGTNGGHESYLDGTIIPEGHRKTFRVMIRDEVRNHEPCHDPW
ncbi:hypothetical protein HAX54_045198, partial [Datura stramonium]|nr:hypothetical protein [Datura stramonium]